MSVACDWNVDAFPLYWLNGLCVIHSYCVSLIPRLGRLICSASSQDLKPYKQNLQMFVIIKEQLLNCIGDDIFVPNELVSLQQWHLSCWASIQRLNLNICRLAFELLKCMLIILIWNEKEVSVWMILKLLDDVITNVIIAPFSSCVQLRDFLVRTNGITDEGLLVTNELSSMISLLPILGLSFIKQLHPVQIQSILPELRTVNLSSAQV